MACACLVAGCSTLEQRVEDHKWQLRSLVSTTALVSNAWLSGHVSSIYAATALERVLMLLDQERSKLGSDADVLRNPTGGELSRTAEKLSRQLASLIADIHRQDATAVRDNLSNLPPARSDRR